MEALFSESSKTLKDISSEYGEPGSTGKTQREKSKRISQPKKAEKIKNNKPLKEPEQTKVEEDLNIEELYKLVVKVHNKYRALHHDTPTLTLSQDCCRTAQVWADNGVYEHSKTG